MKCNKHKYAFDIAIVSFDDHICNASTSCSIDFESNQFPNSIDIINEIIKNCKNNYDPEILYMKIFGHNPSLKYTNYLPIISCFHNGTTYYYSITNIRKT